MFAHSDYLILMPSLAMLALATMLVIAWIIQRSQSFLLWQSGAYSLTALPLGMQSLLSLEVLNRYVLVIGCFYLLGAWCLANSWAERWKVSVQQNAAVIIAIFTLATLHYFSSIEQNVWARVSSFSIGSGLILLLPILRIRAKKISFDWLDRSLLWLSIIFTA